MRTLSALPWSSATPVTNPRNALSIAKERGLSLIAVQSNAYSAQTEAGALGKKLEDYVDIVINNHLPPGDSLVKLNAAGLKTGAGSTVVGAFILNALLTEVIEQLNSSGKIPPIFISANLPSTQAHNQRFYEHYRARNLHL